MSQLHFYKPLNLAYVSCVGAQHISTAYQKLTEWAALHKLLSPETKMLSIYYDSFKDTPADEVRIRACMTLAKTPKDKGDISFMLFEPGLCFSAKFVIAMDEFQESWLSHYAQLRAQNLLMAKRPVFEIYHNNMQEHPHNLAKVELCVPVVNDELAST